MSLSPNLFSEDPEKITKALEFLEGGDHDQLVVAYHFALLFLLKKVQTLQEQVDHLIELTDR